MDAAAQIAELEARVAEAERQNAEKDRLLAERDATIADLIVQLRRRTRKEHRDHLQPDRVRWCNRVLEAVEAVRPDQPIEALATRFARGGKVSTPERFRSGGPEQ